MVDSRFDGALLPGGQRHLYIHARLRLPLCPQFHCHPRVGCPRRIETASAWTPPSYALAFRMNTALIYALMAPSHLFILTEPVLADKRSWSRSHCHDIWKLRSSRIPLHHGRITVARSQLAATSRNRGQSVCAPVCNVGTPQCEAPIRQCGLFDGKCATYYRHRLH